MTVPRILILSAGFGEGHNSAARGLAAAFDGKAEVEVFDPCAVGLPHIDRWLKKLYLWTIKRFPSGWAFFFKFTDSAKPPGRFTLGLFSGIRSALEAKLTSYHPDVVISTHMLYPPFVQDYRRRQGIDYKQKADCKQGIDHGQKVDCPQEFACKNYVCVTDSLVIHGSWRSCPNVDGWFVTDEGTREGLIASGLPPEKVIATGFPVHPRLEAFPGLALDSWRKGDPIRILYFPHTGTGKTLAELNTLLNDFPDIHVTVVLGRNVRALYKTVAPFRRSHPHRIKLIGWTRRVPELLNTHHLVISKAGGATVHEVLNAHTPMLVNHLVAGQEEGNVHLMENHGVGHLTLNPEDLRTTLESIFYADEPAWFAMKSRLFALPFLGGARRCAEFVLEHQPKTDR